MYELTPSHIHKFLDTACDNYYIMLLLPLPSAKILTICLLLFPTLPPPVATIPLPAGDSNPNLGTTLPGNASVSLFEMIRTKSGLTIQPENNILFRRLGTTAAIRAYGRVLIQMELALPLAMLTSTT